MLEYYDSLHLDGSRVLRTLGRWLRDDCRDKGLPPPPQPLRMLQPRAGVPLQADAHSCGVLMATMAERLAAGWGPPFAFSLGDAGQLRLGMTVDILTCSVLG